MGNKNQKNLNLSIYLFKKIKISKAFLEHLKWVAFVYYKTFLKNT